MEQIQFYVNIIVPFLLLTLGLLYKRIGKIEERQYDSKGETVTKQELKEELKDLETRVLHTIGDKMDNIQRDFAFIKDMLMGKSNKSGD